MVNYVYAKSLYENIGVDVDNAVKTLSEIKISMHCWQGDDVGGFFNQDGLSGGIAATGNYPGKARCADELMSDIDVALKLIPGKHKLNLHAIYADNDCKNIDIDSLEPENFKSWIDFAKQRELGLDINPTLFSHPMAADGLTLSHPDKKVREFWIKHCKAMRKTGEYFGKELGITCLNNIWIPDGYKQTPADRLSPRQRLCDSLDEIFADKYDKRYLLDSVESKLFGIGVEAYTVGSHEFYMNYAAKNDVLCLLDNGHFHPTEDVSDKIPSLLLFSDKIALHVTRGLRWDSDHVVAFNDELKAIANEIVRCKAIDRVMIGLDYFDASINRIAAWVIGMRNMQKALLSSLLTPHEMLSDLQKKGDYTRMFMLQQELNSYPFSIIWDAFCEQSGVPVREDWYKTVEKYEADVLSLR